MIELLQVPARGLTIPLRRVVLVGAAGAGKRTVARRAAFRSGATLVRDAVDPPEGDDRIVAVASDRLRGGDGAAALRAWADDGHGAVVWLAPPAAEIRIRTGSSGACDEDWLARVADARIPGSPSTDECAGAVCAMLMKPGAPHEPQCLVTRLLMDDVNPQALVRHLRGAWRA